MIGIGLSSNLVGVKTDKVIQPRLKIFQDMVGMISGKLGVQGFQNSPLGKITLRKERPDMMSRTAQGEKSLVRRRGLSQGIILQQCFLVGIAMFIIPMFGRIQPHLKKRLGTPFQVGRDIFDAFEFLDPRRTRVFGNV